MNIIRIVTCARIAPLILQTSMLHGMGCATEESEESPEVVLTPVDNAPVTGDNDRAVDEESPEGATNLVQCGAFFSSSGRSRDGCLFTAGSCTDDATYAIFCERGACRCLRNALEQSAPNIDECPSSAEGLSAACNWSLATQAGNTSGQADDD